MSSLITRFRELPYDVVVLICLFTGKFRYDKNGQLHSIINMHDYLHIDYHLQVLLHKRSYKYEYQFIENHIVFIYRRLNIVNTQQQVLIQHINNVPIAVISTKPDNTKKDKVHHTYNQNPKDTSHHKYNKNPKNNLRTNYKTNFRRLL